MNLVLPLSTKALHARMLNLKERGSNVVEKKASEQPGSSIKHQHHLQDWGSRRIIRARLRFCKKKKKRQRNSPELDSVESLWLILKRQLDKQEPTKSKSPPSVYVPPSGRLEPDLIHVSIFMLGLHFKPGLGSYLA